MMYIDGQLGIYFWGRLINSNLSGQGKEGIFVLTAHVSNGSVSVWWGVSGGSLGYVNTRSYNF